MFVDRFNLGCAVCDFCRLIIYKLYLIILVLKSQGSLIKIIIATAYKMI